MTDTLLSPQGTNKDEQWNEILKCCVLSCIAHPDSKRKTVEVLKEDFNKSFHIDQMYRMMDWLYYPHIDKTKSLVGG